MHPLGHRVMLVVVILLEAGIEDGKAGQTDSRSFKTCRGLAGVVK